MGWWWLLLHWDVEEGSECMRVEREKEK